MSRRVDFLIALCILIADANHALAADKIFKPADITTFIGFVISDTSSNHISDPKIRARFAKSIGTICSGYRSVVPTPTPEEQAWLKTELDPKNASNRIVAAASSQIYARNSSANVLDQCIGFTDAISNGTDNLHNWTGLAIDLNQGDLSDNLSRVGTSGVDPQVLSGADIYLRWAVSAILNRIIMPQE